MRLSTPPNAQPEPGIRPRQQFDLQRLCESLRRADPDILEIVLFGSSAYALDLARDVDVVITTRARKDNVVYRDAAECEALVDVDVLVREPGEPMGRDIALSVYTFGRSLFGDGETVKEARSYMAIPTYEEARLMLQVADRVLGLAHTAEGPFFRDQHYRAAFDSLFGAARYAAMTFLSTENQYTAMDKLEGLPRPGLRAWEPALLRSTENARWGQLRRQLPPPFSKRFRQLINTLHIQYGYGGNYPGDTPDEAFARWRDTVSRFIEDLENATLAHTEEPP